MPMFAPASTIVGRLERDLEVVLQSPQDEVERQDVRRTQPDLNRVPDARNARDGLTRPATQEARRFGDDTTEPQVPSMGPEAPAERAQRHACLAHHEPSCRERKPHALPYGDALPRTSSVMSVPIV